MCYYTIRNQVPPLKRHSITLVLFAAAFLVIAHGHALAQQRNGPPLSTTPKIHNDFPFQTMWDDAVLMSANSGKPTLAFNLDLIDSNNIKLAQEVIDNKGLQAFIRSHFEPALNDFAIDPPFTVGLDSLRNLGLRLSGLEKDYQIALRPTIIVIGPDKIEIDRIIFPQNLTTGQLQSRLTEILKGRNTLESTRTTFWRDTNSIVMRQRLIDMFEERSKYDSVLYHLEVLERNKQYPSVARNAWIRYADLRLHVEGKLGPLDSLMAILGPHGADSALHYSLLHEVLDFYQHGKKADSVSATFEQIMAFTHERDPDLLNDYAWHLANYTKQWEKADSLIDEAIGKKSNDPNYYDTRALINKELLHIDDAIRDEEIALRYAKDDDRNYFNEQLQYYRSLKSKSEATLQPGTQEIPQPIQKKH